MKRITINVTADDIENGKPDEGGLCPVALACKREGLDHVHVDDVGIIYQLEGEWIGKSVTPLEAAKFIRDFDDFRNVKPFSFDIDVQELEDVL